MTMTRPGVQKRTSAPDWIRCDACQCLIYTRRLERSLLVCPECSNHRRVEPDARIHQLADPGSVAPLEAGPPSVDLLGFVDAMPYPERLRLARSKTGAEEAVRCAVVEIGGYPTALAVMDFRFLGGSLGTAVGEAVCRAAEVALERRIPLVIVTASGGARMQEGSLALMQMAATSQALGRMREAGLLTVSVVTDPTYGGVAASFATNTDLVIAEPGARLGFAGPRVIAQTIGQELPPGFQTAEFLLEHGLVDRVEERRDLRPRLTALLAIAAGASARVPAPAGTTVVRSAEGLARRDAWEVVQRARERDRPTMRDHVLRVVDNFVELHGDRLGADCPAIVAGLGHVGGRGVAVIGHQKGHTTGELVASNFGMPSPEGYRKALRVMRLAERLGLPVVTLVDTPGAHPGIEAEERGQAQAIAENVLAMSTLRVPVVTVVTGEGGSGGALALAVADQVLVTENGTYSVISPEGCSSILWGTAADSSRAARALRLTAPDLLRFGVVDGVVPEPAGGSHEDPPAASDLLRAAVLEVLAGIESLPGAELVEHRRTRFRRFADVSAMAVLAEKGDDEDG